ncbi:hypothetical protein AB8O38_07440 [Saccharomonospora xinjiangensis]|uniref:hypothetical protein n=1 Tax=Saccharomonospora xinjiangensis TaxID=75294 RepID=UPI00350FB8E5
MAKPGADANAREVSSVIEPAHRRSNVYAGIDPLTRKRMYLSELTADENVAQWIFTRLLAHLATVEMLPEHRDRCEAAVRQLGVEPTNEAFLFSCETTFIARTT